MRLLHPPRQTEIEAHRHKADATRKVTPALCLVACACVAATLAGCGWFRARPVPAADATPAVLSAPAYPDARPEAEARAACANYAAVIAGSTFPRDAIIRGLDGGEATVWFQVDGAKLTILSVLSSDPAFGAAAAQSVQQLTCRTDGPTVFRMPLAWRTKR